MLPSGVTKNNFNTFLFWTAVVVVGGFILCMLWDWVVGYRSEKQRRLDDDAEQLAWVDEVIIEIPGPATSRPLLPEKA